MATRTSSAAPLPVRRALTQMGEDLATWRRLRHLTVAEVADRAGIGTSTVIRLEHGEGASLANTLAVARALGVLDLIARSLDPYETDLGRARADETLPRRVRRKAAP
ncbi:helix-turn-helix domain-containing protein [Demequina capsici]|uniref:Helix-turn-helix transcriptional regulator n=1 Tax=Demequina capsici TaxID=3075620 RepID=A0AA96F6B3_9MICO|nr:helix-turn-helix transcriptional regulator [Demequina sp. OYTSA14]WNM23515.1 helix-turn-helix transcriptional regulator [Demequina sp. OYTSA14]